MGLHSNNEGVLSHFVHPLLIQGSAVRPRELCLVSTKIPKSAPKKVGNGPHDRTPAHSGHSAANSLSVSIFRGCYTSLQ